MVPNEMVRWEEECMLYGVWFVFVCICVYVCCCIYTHNARHKGTYLIIFCPFNGIAKRHIVYILVYNANVWEEREG